MDSYLNLITGLVERALRTDGFIGDFKVTNVRVNKKSYTAKVALTYGGMNCTYKFILPKEKGRFKLTKVSEVKAAA